MLLVLLFTAPPAAALEFDLTRRLPGSPDGRAECTASFEVAPSGAPREATVAGCDGAEARATRKLLAQMRFAADTGPSALHVHWCLGDEPCAAPSAWTDADRPAGAPPVASLAATHAVHPAWPVGVIDQPEVPVTCWARVYVDGRSGAPQAVEARDCATAYFGPAAVALLDWRFQAVDGVDGLVQSDVALRFEPEDEPTIALRPAFAPTVARKDVKRGPPGSPD